MGNLQIKGIPSELHELLRERATAERTTMRDYVLRLIERDLTRPTMREWLDRVRSRGALAGELSREEIAETIRRGREARSEQIVAAIEARGRPGGGSPSRSR